MLVLHNPTTSIIQHSVLVPCTSDYRGSTVYSCVIGIKNCVSCTGNSRGQVINVHGKKCRPKYRSLGNSKSPCHLPDEQVVVFEEGQAENAIQNVSPVAKLLAYFKMNAADPLARTILYPDFLRFFTWNSRNKCWQRRKRGFTSPHGDAQLVGTTLGRIPTISLHAHQSELYYLRMLLHNKPGHRATKNSELYTDTLPNIPACMPMQGAIGG